MGLGKTITTIALLYYLYLTMRKRGTQQVGATLIVCPATLINQWQDELKTWSLPTMHAPSVYVFNNSSTAKDKKMLV